VTAFRRPYDGNVNPHHRGSGRSRDGCQGFVGARGGVGCWLGGRCVVPGWVLGGVVRTASYWFARARFVGGCWKSWRARVVVGHGVFLARVLVHRSCCWVSALSKFDVGPCPGTPPFRPTRSGCQRRLLLNSGLILPRCDDRGGCPWVGVWVGYVVSGR